MVDRISDVICSACERRFASPEGLSEHLCPGLRPTLDAIAARVAALDTSWKRLAACRGQPTEWFFPPEKRVDSGTLRRHAAAVIRRYCARCPVRLPCLQWALTVPEMHGIWGGTTSHQRRKLRRRRQTAGLLPPDAADPPDCEDGPDG